MQKKMENDIEDGFMKGVVGIMENRSLNNFQYHVKVYFRYQIPLYMKESGTFTCEHLGFSISAFLGG